MVKWFHIIKRLTKNEYGINVLLINVSSMNLQLLSIPLFFALGERKCPWINRKFFYSHVNNNKFADNLRLIYG